MKNLSNKYLNKYSDFHFIYIENIWDIIILKLDNKKAERLGSASNYLY